MASEKRNTDANALRRGRCSQRGATYFMTFCVVDRKPVLIPDVAHGLVAEAQQMVREGIWTLRCITVMPDHVHLLIILGAYLTLAQSVTRLKVKAKPAINVKAGRWQSNFYDHRLRANDSLEATMRYIWMNPYRKNLIPVTEEWPWSYCRPEDWECFKGSTDSGYPFPEWLV